MNKRILQDYKSRDIRAVGNELAFLDLVVMFIFRLIVGILVILALTFVW